MSILAGNQDDVSESNDMSILAGNQGDVSERNDMAIHEQLKSN